MASLLTRAKLLCRSPGIWAETEFRLWDLSASVIGEAVLGMSRLAAAPEILGDPVVAAGRQTVEADPTSQNSRSVVWARALTLWADL